MPRLVTDGRAAESAYRAWDIERPWVIAVDTETTGVDWYDTPFCATVSYRDRMNRIRSGFFDLEDAGARESLRLILLGTPEWVGHNMKFDLQKLILAGIIERGDLDV